MPINKLLEFAVQAGSTKDKLKPCIADPKTQDLVRQSMAEGKAMDVTSTPTSFVVLLEDFLVRADHSAAIASNALRPFRTLTTFSSRQGRNLV